MEMDARPATVVKTKAPRGRRRDPALDGVILEAALDVLAEVGVEGMTMDMVATRAKAGKATVYRRWSSKSELVLDAVRRLRGPEVTLADLPDTGTFRGDLVAMQRPGPVEEQARKLKVVAGISSAMYRDPALAEAAHAALVEPWIEVNRLLIGRSVQRGEFPASTDVEALSQVIPSMATYRSLIEHRPPDGDYLLALADDVLLPAIRGATQT